MNICKTETNPLRKRWQERGLRVQESKRLLLEAVSVLRVTDGNYVREGNEDDTCHYCPGHEVADLIYGIVAAIDESPTFGEEAPFETLGRGIVTGLMND